MSSVGSFVLECVSSGRWRRGLLALQSSGTPSAGPALRHAAVALAVATAPHNWHAALSLLQPRDARDETLLVCGLVASLPRSPALTASAETRVIRDLLRDAAPPQPRRQAALSAATPSPGSAVSGSPHEGDKPDKEGQQAQRRLLSQVLRWCAQDTATSLLRDVPPLAVLSAAARPLRATSSSSPADALCVSRLAALASLHEAANEVYAHFPLDDVAPPASATPVRGPGAATPPLHGRRAREQARIVAQRAVAAEAARAAQVHASVRAALQGLTQSAVAVPPAEREVVDKATLAVLNHGRLRYPAAADLGTLLRVVAQDVRGPRARAVATPRQSPETVPPSLSSPPPPPPPAPRPPAPPVSWPLALSLVDACPTLTPELFALYVRCVGLRAAHQWARALSHATAYWERYGPIDGRAVADETAAASDDSPPPRRVPLEEACLMLWLLSRGSWSAAVTFYQTTTPIASRLGDGSVWGHWRAYAEDCLARTAVPSPVFLHTFPARRAARAGDDDVHAHRADAARRRPSVRLAASTRRHVARALAAGLRLEELQLSAVARHWASGGHWQELLALYTRLPTEEFQRRLVQCLVAPLTATPRADAVPRPSSATAIVEVLADVGEAQRRRERGLVPPPGTHVGWLLIRSSRDGREALRVFRRCVQLGTECKPQLLSALMDAQVPRPQLETILRHYPGAANDGVRRRAADEFHITLS